MSRARRRAAIAGVAIVVLLLAGRWLVAWLSEWWWAGTVSRPAASFMTRWILLGLGLDAAAVLVASLWFALQALLVARAIASVQVTRRLGDLQLREAVPTRLLLFGAVATGVLLGLITGAGARSWRAPLLLAWHGVHFGVNDPFLDRDVGVFVGQLPVWTLAWQYAMMLAVVGLAFTAVLYLAIGAVRRQNGSLQVHPDARRQIGVLLAVLAVVIAVGYILAPWHVAGSALGPSDESAVDLRMHISDLLAGVALGVAALSIAWAVRGRHSIVTGAWALMGLGALLDHTVVPALTDTTFPTPARQAEVRRFDQLAWGIRIDQAVPPRDTVPHVTALWDDVALALLVERSDPAGALLAATPSTVSVDGHLTPAWLVATPTAADSLRIDVLAVAAGTVGPDRTPLRLDGGDDASSPDAAVWTSIADPRLRPDAPAWRPMRGAVPAGNVFRRLVLAWARQEPGMLHDTRAHAVDWHLDPVERVRTLLPMVSWLPADLLLVDGRPTWVVQGVLPIDEFPLATRGHWRGALVAGVVPAFVATLDAATAELHVHLDPDADSLAAAWAGAIGPLVEPAATLPDAVRRGLTYPAAWFESQLEVLEDPAWAVGRRPTSSITGLPEQSVAGWIGAATPVRDMLFEDPQRRVPVALVTASRREGIPSLDLAHYESAEARAQNALELQRLWGFSPELRHLRDSARAAGDSLRAGDVHWYLGAGALAAWEPVLALAPRQPPALLWIATAVGDQVGGARDPAAAWRAVTAPGAQVAPTGPSSSAVVAEARHWLQVADSALARGDLTAFGRAFEALRAILAPPR